MVDNAGGLSAAFNNLVNIGGDSGTFAEVFQIVSGLLGVAIESSPESAVASRERGITVTE